jgi:hypothetical protein
VINEIMYNPAGCKPEFVELYNFTADAVSLQDGTHPWRFTDGIDFAFPAGASIPASGYALRWRRPGFLAHATDLRRSRILLRLSPKLTAALTRRTGLAARGSFQNGDQSENSGSRPWHEGCRTAATARLIVPSRTGRHVGAPRRVRRRRSI